MLVPASIQRSGGRNPVGESQNRPFQLWFNRFLRVAFQGSRVTSDGGLILVRELDERLGLSGLIEEHLVDSRTGRNRQFPLADLLRQSVYSRLAGYEDLNDAARLSADPTFRLLGSEKVWERGSCDRATCTARRAGKSCCCRRSSDRCRTGRRVVGHLSGLATSRPSDRRR